MEQLTEQEMTVEEARAALDFVPSQLLDDCHQSLLPGIAGEYRYRGDRLFVWRVMLGSAERAYQRLPRAERHWQSFAQYAVGQGVPPAALDSLDMTEAEVRGFTPTVPPTLLALCPADRLRRMAREFRGSPEHLSLVLGMVLYHLAANPEHLAARAEGGQTLLEYAAGLGLPVAELVG